MTIIIFIFLLLNINCYTFVPYICENNEKSNDQIEKNYIEELVNLDGDIQKLIKFGSRGSNLTVSGNSLIETSIHGGSWLDTFKSDEGVDWTYSNRIKIENNSIFMIPTKLNPGTNTVALWHFDEGLGTTVYDETSNDNDGVLGGDGLGTDLPAWSNGITGNALEFDGDDDYILVPHSSSLYISDDITVSAWIMKNGTRSNNIVIKFDPWSTEFFWMYARKYAYFRVQNEGSVGKTLSSQTIVANTGWHHIVGTRNKTEGKIRFIFQFSIHI